MLGGQAVLPDEVGLDVVGHRHRPLPPVGEVAQGAAGVKDPVGGGDEGKLHLPAQGAAQKGGDAGVGVDHVGPLLPEHPAQNRPGLSHVPDAPPVEGGLIVPDAGGGDFGDIDPAVGDDGQVVPLVLQLLGQLNDMGLGPADVQAHCDHQYLHVVPLFPGLNRHPSPCR